MTYEEFKMAEDMKRENRRRELERRANLAYNEGLWDAVKFNPFKWYAYFVFRKPV